MNHYTYGETTSDPVILMNGSRIHLTRFVALCGRAVGEADYPPVPMPTERPPKVCKSCWRRAVRDNEYNRQEP